MAKLVTVYWRDIPSQLIAKKGRKTAKVLLSERFQEAIDSAAMRAGKGTTDDYLADWRREETPCDDDLDAVIHARAAEIEASFSDQDLRDFVLALGEITRGQETPETQKAQKVQEEQQ